VAALLLTKGKKWGSNRAPQQAEATEATALSLSRSFALSLSLAQELGISQRLNAQALAVPVQRVLQLHAVLDAARALPRVHLHGADLARQLRPLAQVVDQVQVVGGTHAGHLLLTHSVL